MTKYILQRIGFALLTLIIIIFVVYTLTAQFADNPFVQTANSKNGAEGQSQVALQNISRQSFEKSIDYHFLPSDWRGKYDQYQNVWKTYKLNPIIRFGYWVNDLFTNKANPFGLPFDDKLFASLGVNSIPQLFFSRLKYSIIITLPAFVISAFLGILFGIFAGYKRGTWVDAVVNFFSLIFIALPSFIVAPILITILASSGVSPTVAIPGTAEAAAQTQSQVVISWLPPIVIIVLGSLSGYISYTRNQVITVLTSNYVLIAKSKGLSRVEIFFKYVLRNISIPLAAIIIPSYIGLLTGGIVIERYWKVPGTSQIIANAFPNGEINIIMFNTFFFTLLGVFTSVLVDVSYTILDPRIKYGTKGSNLWKLFLVTRKRNEEFARMKAKGI
ncbi:ABC transporter permease [Mycoplasma sp. 246B]